jgi:hypothetical protein
MPLAVRRVLGMGGEGEGNGAEGERDAEHSKTSLRENQKYRQRTPWMAAATDRACKRGFPKMPG